MHIVPAPVQYEPLDGVEFRWPEKAGIVAACGQLQPQAAYLVGELHRRCSLEDATVADCATISQQSAVQLEIREIPEACQVLCRDEAYELVVAAEGIRIGAESPRGVFYGIQSLLQLLPWSLDTPQTSPTLQGCRIIDYPRFHWRGVLLDTGRHIFRIEFIKKLLDLMALHKLNKFHWHLTEDQGWRIEIRALPLLTEVGAYRGESRYGGFYTRDQIRDIVKYADERCIEVIPEIELPGHCMAALACYPHLSCTGAVSEVPTQWGVQNDVYCAGKDSTFQFLETVLDEVMELFPSKHIHIGGDECPKTRWASCEACQSRIKSEDLAGEEQLQTYFINRVAHHLRKQGRCIIGWDEILEGGIPDEAVVMCWRGTIGGVAATKHKHQVIMTPNTRCYFDYRQSVSMEEPGTWYAMLPLEWVYLFDPCCKAGKLDMRLFCPPESLPNPTDPELHNREAPAACAQATAASTKASEGDLAAPRSHSSSLSDTDALTGDCLTCTQPTSTSLSTTPLTSTPPQQASPLSEHAGAAAAVAAAAAADRISAAEAANTTSSSQNLAETHCGDFQCQCVDAGSARCAMDTDYVAEEADTERMAAGCIGVAQAAHAGGCAAPRVRHRDDERANMAVDSDGNGMAVDGDGNGMGVDSDGNGMGVDGDGDGNNNNNNNGMVVDGDGSTNNKKNNNKGSSSKSRAEQEASAALAAMDAEDCEGGGYGDQLGVAACGVVPGPPVAEEQRLDVPDDVADAPTEEQFERRAQALAQLQQEQWAQLQCTLEPEDQQYIIGGQANLWTEFISDENTAEYMLLPRLCALAECVWSPLAARHWQGFIDRTHEFLGKLSLAGYNHRPLQFQPSGGAGGATTGCTDATR